MKKIFLIITVLFFGLSIYSQNNYISGKFYMTENGTYFQGVNKTSYNLPILITAVNEAKNQKLSWNLNLAPYNKFTISSNNGWTWEAYEKLYITFSNGETIYWVFSPKNTSFKGLTPKKSCSKAGCDCMKYKSEAGLDYPYGVWCKKCGHHIDYHHK